MDVFEDGDEINGDRDRMMEVERGMEMRQT